MTKDFADLLVSRKREGVAYVVIGGMAVHLDRAVAGNAETARRAVGAWGSFDPEYTAEEFISGDILSFGGLLRVEIHSGVPGVEWQDVWSGRVEGEFLGIPTLRRNRRVDQDEAGNRERRKGSARCGASRTAPQAEGPEVMDAVDFTVRWL